MSTRCQVKVTNGEQSLTLYHHSDGYPSNMLPLIRKAWEKYGQEWEGARVYKVASMLCAIDPVQFEPLDYHGLHGDIAYYYVVDCNDTAHIGTKPIWSVATHVVGWGKEPRKIAEARVNAITDEYADQLESAP